MPAQNSSSNTPKPLTIFLVRHGQAKDPQTDIAADPDLTRLGRRQASRIARRLSREHFDHIYVSDLSRAYRTGERILKFHPGVPVTVTKAIREIAQDHSMFSTPAREKEEELIRQERQRIEAFAEGLLDEHDFGRQILIVAHGNLIRTLIPLIAGYDPRNFIMIELENTSVTILDRYPSNHAILRLANCAKHLQSREITR